MQTANIATILELVESMKKAQSKIDFAYQTGGLDKQLEVGPKSFVQLVGKIEGAWRYYQFWMDTDAAVNVRDQLLGSFLNETVGRFKVIGIYESTIETPHK